MFPRDLISGFFFLSEIFIGFLGNSMLFILYMYTFLLQPRLKKPIDMIFTHLTLVNVLSVVFRLIPDVMASFAVKLLFHDVGCKAVLYAYSVTRGLSICTTSLLSAFQAITVSSNHSKWAWLKSKLESCIFPSLLLIWVINTFLYIPMVGNVEGQINFTVVGSRDSQTYCRSNQVRHHTTLSLATALTIRDILFVFLMMGTSLYMVTLLFRHNRRTRHVHSSRVSSQASSEKKATHSILLLVGFFMFLHFSNTFVTFYSFHRPKNSLVLDLISGALSSGYPIICPYVMMNNRRIISTFISSFSNFECTFSTKGCHG
ncbi:LOW QUALITY PROTEIN: vomeronasal type-1 receptor 4-like [Phodopus roborovskii]|uniref:LOW QUALITY PROTEIN: vomeronasal type-1 receptor 4-like n=1 Tax=Phodopus roborovskii TaxID=109678 RepID=UPI0021E45F90|nr:LOW QUALITY PROTEIN: vomeronasal type-1 receptor 4-like [Phodopus roborovskii]